MLRHASCDNARVLLHMLETIAVIGQEARTPEACQHLLEHVSLIEAESKVGALIEPDRLQIRLRAEDLRRRLSGAPSNTEKARDECKSHNRPLQA
jgi:hypothetical protein